METQKSRWVVRTNYIHGKDAAPPPEEFVPVEGWRWVGDWEPFGVLQVGVGASCAWRRLQERVDTDRPAADLTGGPPAESSGEDSLNPTLWDAVSSWYLWHALGIGAPRQRPWAAVHYVMEAWAAHSEEQPFASQGETLFALEYVSAGLAGTSDTKVVDAIGLDSTGAPNGQRYRLRAGMAARESEGGEVLILVEDVFSPTRVQGLSLSVAGARQLAHQLLAGVAEAKRAECDAFERRVREEARETRAAAEKATGTTSVPSRTKPVLEDPRAVEAARKVRVALGLEPRDTVDELGNVHDIPDGAFPPPKPASCTREGLCPLVRLSSNRIGCRRCDRFFEQGQAGFEGAALYLASLPDEEG